MLEEDFGSFGIFFFFFRDTKHDNTPVIAVISRGGHALTVAKMHILIRVLTLDLTFFFPSSSPPPPSSSSLPPFSADSQVASSRQKHTLPLTHG